MKFKINGIATGIVLTFGILAIIGIVSASLPTFINGGGPPLNAANLNAIVDVAQAPRGYDAIVYLSGSSVIAKWSNGTTINSGTAGTDDATVIQDFINKVTTVRGRGYIMPGDYLINTELVVANKIGFEIDGAGTPAYGDYTTGTVFKWTGATGSTIITFTDTDHCKIQNIKLDGNGVSNINGIIVQSSSGLCVNAFELCNFHIYRVNKGLIVQGVGGYTNGQFANLNIHDFYINNPTSSGIEINIRNIAGKISDGEIDHTGTSIGINVIECQPGFKIRNIGIGDSTAAGTSTGIRCASVPQGLIIEDCDDEGLGYFYIASISASNWLNPTVIRNCLVQSDIIITANGNRNVLQFETCKFVGAEIKEAVDYNGELYWTFINCFFDDNTILHPNSYLGQLTTIGCTYHSGASVDLKFGDNRATWKSINDVILCSITLSDVKGSFSFEKPGAYEGTATVANGATSVTVTHNYPTTPRETQINVVPTNNMGNAAKFWISSITATTFVINVNADPGATTATFSWSIV